MVGISNEGAKSDMELDEDERQETKLNRRTRYIDDLSQNRRGEGSGPVSVGKGSKGCG